MFEQDAYSLKVRDADPGWPVPCREEVTFSKEESELVIKKLKGLSSSYTVTHLGELYPISPSFSYR